MPEFDPLTPENLRPILREQFGRVVRDKQAAEQKKTMAMLKLLELIVSGRIRQRPGEDYDATICRLIVHGLSDAKANAATSRSFKRLLALIKDADRWTTSFSDVVAMRSWRGKRAVTRAMLLLVMVANLIGPVELTGWLQRPNPNLEGRAPVDLMRGDGWAILADLIDDMLTGSPT